MEPSPMRANTTAWIQAIALVGVTACQSSPEQPSQPRTDLKPPSAAEPSVADGHASGAGEPALRHVKPPWRDMGFVPSEGLRTERLVLEPLAPRHVELDHAALMGSREHLLRTLHWGDWPREGFTVEENLEDLEMHWGEFEDRTGFAFTVLNPARDRCLGCVYIQPIGPDAFEVNRATLAFWVIEEEVETGLDQHLLETLLPWFEAEWPFEAVVLLIHDENARGADLALGCGLEFVEDAEVPGHQVYRWAR